jgi:hypothetical protein
MDHDAPCCPDCVGVARHYLCTGDLLPRASVAMMFNRIVLGVRANGTRQIAARTVVRKWAFAGHRGSGYLTPSEMHARLKALLERMAKDLNARLDLVSAIP